MLGTSYHIEPADDRIHYEIVTDPSRLSLISVWEHNRPPDPARVKEIQDHLEHTNICDGQILLAVVNGTCVCYDGAHRLLACRSVFPKGGVQVRIIHDSTPQEVRKEFERVNRSIPVPELYFSVDEISSRVTSLVQDVVKSMCTLYRQYVSSSRRPKRPNFNRDRFVEDLGTTIRESLPNETILKLTQDDVGRWLSEINHTIRAHHYSGVKRIKASRSIITKCEKQNMFLFATDWVRNLQDYLNRPDTPILHAGSP